MLCCGEVVRVPSVLQLVDAFGEGGIGMHVLKVVAQQNDCVAEDVGWHYTKQ